MERQEACLDRKITNLDISLDRHLSMLSDVKLVMIMVDTDSYEHDQIQVVRLMNLVENKTREANLSRAKACNSVLSGIDHRTHGNRSQANIILRKVERWLERGDMMNAEITEHSSQIEECNNRILMAECQSRQASTAKRDLEYDIIGIQYHLFNARRHHEELKRSFEANRKFFLQLRDEEERFGLVSISESEYWSALRDIFSECHKV